MTRLKTILNLSCLLLFSLNLSCQYRTVNILYVLPKNYEGPIIVLYDQKDGKPKEYYHNDWRVYRINKEGTLKTQFEYEAKSYLNMQFCYENEEEKDWMEPLYIYHYPDKWKEYPPRLLTPKKVYLFGGTTNIDHCGLATFMYYGKSKDTIEQLINKYESSYPKADSTLGPMLINEIISSLRLPCK